jgi:hypothetical protein
MMGEFGLAPTLDSLAQTGQAESGSKRSAEAGLVDKAQRGLFAGNPARRKPPKMVVAMPFESVAEFQ